MWELYSVNKRVHGPTSEEVANDSDRFGRYLASKQSYGQAEQLLKKALSCLLYTSPSPRDRTRSRMPSSA